MEEPSNQTLAYTTTLQTWTPEHNDTLFEHDHLIFDCLILPIAVLGMCVAIYGIYSLFKTDKSSSVFVINLLICDLIQTSSTLTAICVEIMFLKCKLFDWLIHAYNVMICFYLFCVMGHIGFMVCISAERYLLIAHPVWYRTKHTTRKSVSVFVTVWITSAIIAITTLVTPHGFIAVFFCPYPLVIFFLVGTWRALSKSMSVPHNDQRRIIGILALILCIYTVLFLPYPVASIYYIHLMKGMNTTDVSDFLRRKPFIEIMGVGQIFIALNPLLDFVLYLLMRKDSKDLLSAPVVCCRRRPEESRASEILERKV